MQREQFVLEFVCTGDVARLCGVSSESVRKWVSRGALRAFGTLPDGTRIYLKTEVDSFAARRASRPDLAALIIEDAEPEQVLEARDGE
jgi:Helix-turn-helix domain